MVTLSSFWRHSLVNHFLNLGIRGLTLASRFSFTFFLGKVYSEELLGEFGLISTTILLCFTLLSFSFESYALREIVQKPKDQQFTYIVNFFFFYVVSYLIVVVFLPFVVLNEFLSADLFKYFAILLLLETINQGLFSLFAIIQRPLTANFILLLSQASWIIIIFIIWIANGLSFPELNITLILIIWILGSIISIAFAIAVIFRIYPKSEFIKIDWTWINAGLKVSTLFFLATLSYKLTEFSDRYIIEMKLGVSSLGVYVFFSQLANLTNAIISVSVILMLYPKLLEEFNNKNKIEFLRVRNTMLKRVLFIGLAVSIFHVFTIDYLLAFLDKETFNKEIYAFYVLLIGNIFMNLSFVSHYCLYSFRMDFVLFLTTLMGPIVSILLNFLLVERLGITGAALATASGFFVVWIIKSYYVSLNIKILDDKG